MCKKQLVVLALCAFVVGLMVGPAAQAGDPTLIAWWKLDDGVGTVALDSSDYGNHGTVMNPNAGLGSGGSAWVDDPDRGMVISFNGADGSGACVTTDVIVPALTMDSGFTWTFWAKQPAAQETNNDLILGNRYGGTASPVQFCKFTPTRFENYNDDGSYVNGINYTSIPADVWIHHAVVKDGAELTYYRDGVVMMTNTMTKTNDPNPFYMGADGFSGVQENWQGYLSDVRLYTRALTAKEVLDVMAGKGPTSEFATEPVPEHEAIDIPRDVVLSWKAGEFAATHDVYFGTVFEDVEAASRANPMGVLLSQGQSQNTFDPPGILALDQIYYWRVDEVNAAPDNTIYKGEIWSFTAEPLAYPIANVVATSNAESPAAPPEKTVDGSGLDADDRHSVESTDMWLTYPPDEEPLYIQYEFDRIYKLHEMLVWNYNSQFEMILGFGLQGVTVQYSVDGTDWTILGDFELARGTGTVTYTANTVVDLGGAAARYVRLVVNSGWGTMGQYGLSEVRFLYIPAHAREPQPGDGETQVAPATALRWRAGREAVSHEVYLGTDAEVMTLVGTADAATFAPGNLEFGKTYYWQVVEVNEAEEIAAWAGDIWSFATMQYALIDGFESYTDDIDAGEAIFDTWLDGWVNNTGSTVGHLESPFAEHTIVRSGHQAMPLFYDNTGSSSYSEAERRFASPQDWTAYGVQALTLYFCGDPDNSAEQMYVKLNGSKILYDGDADDLKETTWRPWTIALADFGVNLRSVTELIIGFEPGGAAGGQGVVYFDDIKLDPTIPAAGRFLVRPWSGDADSGMSSNKTYTHTGKFTGEGVDGEPILAGNGVQFERDRDSSGTNWTLTGPATNVFDTSNPVNVTGDGAALVRGFVYGDQDDSHPVLTLTGLEPGTAYVATFYAVGYGDAGGRFVDVTPGDNPHNPTRIDQNGAGAGNGLLIQYTYTAAGTEMSFAFDALVTGDSWHHYAFSNEVASSN